MKRRVMPSRPAHALALMLTLALPLAACSETPREEAPLAGATIGGDFALVGEDGRTVRWSDFDGQWRIVYFGYTFCPDVCPVDAQAIGQGLRQFEAQSPDLGRSITPIFITIDPDRDTPEVVGEFAGNFHPRMVGLTGGADEIAAVAKLFAVYANKGAETSNGGYLMDHSRAAMLFDPEGRPVALLPSEQGGTAVAQELARWVH
ncbi:SCO family protein [Croceicoccus sp. F390]|uniref:SCO family protein n=1 Tax=Croceicoccus esteveae TaxID=3075597 RepID=A0ABU2ZEX4_9SPHN|nr:SCO family protein [Croceicoccus sp. F390]MDT0575139.1 SCO family protein [Croceicoccus sp. F390]